MLSADRIEPLGVQTQTLAHLSKTVCCPPSSNKPRHHYVHFLSAQGTRQNAPQKPVFRMSVSYGHFLHYWHTHLSTNSVQQWFVFCTHHISHISSQASASLTQSLINKNINFCKIFIRSKIVDCDKWRKLIVRIYLNWEKSFSHSKYYNSVYIVYRYLLCLALNINCSKSNSFITSFYHSIFVSYFHIKK